MINQINVDPLAARPRADQRTATALEHLVRNLLNAADHRQKGQGRRGRQTNGAVSRVQGSADRRQYVGAAEARQSNDGNRGRAQG